jgi:hypothetical protein
LVVLAGAIKDGLRISILLLLKIKIGYHIIQNSLNLLKWIPAFIAYLPDL